MSRERYELSQKYHNDLEKEKNERYSMIDDCQNILEVLAKLGTTHLEEEELNDYLYFKQQQTKIDEKLAKYATQMTYGNDIKKKQSSTEYNDMMEKRITFKNKYVVDELKEYQNDKKFMNGMRLARFVDADKKVLEKAAGFIKEEQERYNNKSIIARFFSYINPFSNECRSLRNKISDMKYLTIKKTNCDSRALEDYVNGNIDEIPYEHGTYYSVENLNYVMGAAYDTKLYSMTDEQFNELGDGDFIDHLEDDLLHEKNQIEENNEKDKDTIQIESLQNVDLNQII